MSDPHSEIAFEVNPVAALFVETDGAYFGLEGVDPWDEPRDARLYAGPWPVVAHPPCARWSRLAGFTQARFGYKIGEDGGCFEAALRAVRAYGGVLEHPAYSKAWDRFGLPEPITHDGWTLGLDGGASCYVEQRRYGMVTKKPTWLYAYGVELPELRWGFEPDSANRFDSTVRLEDGRRSGIAAFRDRDGNGQTIHSPLEFRDALLSIARSAYSLRGVAA